MHSKWKERGHFLQVNDTFPVFLQLQHLVADRPFFFFPFFSIFLPPFALGFFEFFLLSPSFSALLLSSSLAITLVKSFWFCPFFSDSSEFQYSQQIIKVKETKTFEEFFFLSQWLYLRKIYLYTIFVRFSFRMIQFNFYFTI